LIPRNLARHLPRFFFGDERNQVLPARVQATRDGEPLEMIILPSEVDYAAGTVKGTANKRLRNGQTIFHARAYFGSD
jgi:hypothetical protein